MKVQCIKEMTSTNDHVFNSVKIGDWIEVNEKSIYTKTNEDPNTSSYYFFLTNDKSNPGINYVNAETEYAFNKDNFITLEQWREQQLNKLI